MQQHKRNIAKRNQKGFTLIEVVLVLAIGGLIFLMAFIAFQQTQRQRRDTQRRADAALITSELQNYAGDYNGRLPNNSLANDSCTTTAADTFGRFLRTYVCRNNTFNSPQRAYTVIASRTTGMVDSDSVDSIMYTNGYDCSGTAQGVSRIQLRLESSVVCRDTR